MKILILSDSHGCVEAMETIVAREKPQAMAIWVTCGPMANSWGSCFQTSHCIRWRGTATAMAGNRGRTKSEPSPWTMW